MVRHVVWDWNGTLFDDVPLLVDSANAALAALSGPRITVNYYRRHFGRPVHTFYESVLGREVTGDEWPRIDDAFHDRYDELIPGASLTSDAAVALQRVGERGLSQSLLSMWRHHRLEPQIRLLGIEHHFTRVDGLRGPAGGHKHPHLSAHIGAVSELVALDAPSDVVVVGDTLDDADAARAVGAACVLYAGGEHTEDRLASAGYPVVSTLLDALDAAGIH